MGKFYVSLFVSTFLLLSGCAGFVAVPNNQPGHCNYASPSINCSVSTNNYMSTTSYVFLPASR